MTAFIKVATLAQLPLGATILVDYDGEEVGLINRNNTIYAMSNSCPHDEGPLFDGDIEGDCLVCPRHGARFNFKTGAYTMPAYQSPARYAVQITGNDILIAPLD